jgi:hypothetical protein
MERQGNHTDIYLHLYTDNTKDVAIYLLNRDIQFEVSEHFIIAMKA